MSASLASLLRIQAHRACNHAQAHTRCCIHASGWFRSTQFLINQTGLHIFKVPIYQFTVPAWKVVAYAKRGSRARRLCRCVVPVRGCPWQMCIKAQGQKCTVGAGQGLVCALNRGCNRHCKGLVLDPTNLLLLDVRQWNDGHKRRPSRR